MFLFQFPVLEKKYAEFYVPFVGLWHMGDVS
jgi:hypothetical protein